MKVIIYLLKLTFWAPRITQDAITSGEKGFFLFLKMLAGSTGVTIGGLSFVFILLGNEEWVRIGAYGLILYVLLGLIMMIFHIQRYGEDIP